MKYKSPSSSPVWATICFVHVGMTGAKAAESHVSCRSKITHKQKHDLTGTNNNLDKIILLRLDLFVSYSGHFIQLCLSHPIKSYSPLQKTFGALQWCASFQLGQHTNSHILCKGEKEAKYYFSIAVFTMIIILFINMSIKLFYIWKQLNYFYFEALLLWTSPQWTIFID